MRHLKRALAGHRSGTLPARFNWNWTPPAQFNWWCITSFSGPQFQMNLRSTCPIIFSGFTDQDVRPKLQHSFANSRHPNATAARFCFLFLRPILLLFPRIFAVLRTVIILDAFPLHHLISSFLVFWFFFIFIRSFFFILSSLFFSFFLIHLVFVDSSRSERFSVDRPDPCRIGR